MSNKLIIVSKLIFFTEENHLINENLRIADLFFKEGIRVAILAQYSTIHILKSKLPEEYETKLIFIDRSAETKEYILELKENGDSLGVIGIVDEDAIFSFNCKLPLFNPDAMTKRIVVSEKVQRYGLPIIEFQNVIDCFKAFNIHKDNYFLMRFGSKFSVISLNNANRYHRPEEEARIKQIFETNLKGAQSSRDQRTLLLLLFHLINEVATNPYYNKIDYWGTFPSSNPENINTSISFIKEAIRVIIGGGPRNGPEILIRHQRMNSKHTIGNVRLKDKSHRDLETLIVNPKLEKNIKGKVVCIIDDYITNGYSAEAAKHLLFAAGVKEVIFISFGKFGKKYYYTDYKVNGDVHSEFNFQFKGENLYEGNFDGKEFYNFRNDTEILSFTELL